MRKAYKGSFTVEAAFVMPIVICVVLLLLEYSMVLHDTVAFYAIAEEAAINTAEKLTEKTAGKLDFDTLSRRRQFFTGNEDVVLAASLEDIKTRAESALLFSRAEGVSVSKTLTGIQVTGHLRMKRTVPLFGRVEKEITLKRSTFRRESKTWAAAVIVDAAKKIIELFGEGAEAAH